MRDESGKTGGSQITECLKMQSIKFKLQAMEGTGSFRFVCFQQMAKVIRVLLKKE